MIDTMDLRMTFDEDAEQYNRFRPHYPQALFDTLIASTNINSGSSLLEIGPGTGQATEPLAKLGSDITAIELGAGLADKARQVLRQYSNVHIIVDSFEDANLPTTSYDLIYSATAFHWVKEEYKFTKTARLLKPGGYLAIIHTEHVSDEKGDDFTFASQPIYQKYSHNGTSTHETFRLPTVRELKEPAFDTSLFKLSGFNIFLATILYSAQEYAGLLSTYSPTIAMPAGRRKSFLSEIEQLINKRFDGSAARNFAFTLTILQKK
jgi:protein-L-isoaspartate O-methyltransferase